MPSRDDSWLSLTPEPERLLPAARAALRSGDDRRRRSCSWPPSGRAPSGSCCGRRRALGGVAARERGARRRDAGDGPAAARRARARRRGQSRRARAGAARARAREHGDDDRHRRHDCADATPSSAIAERARRFVDEELIPREEAPSAPAGGCPPRRSPRSSARRIDAGLSGGLHAVAHGGQGWSHVDWALVEEQLGRSTNALSWHVPTPTTSGRRHARSRSSASCGRCCAARLQDAYAVTEARRRLRPVRDRDDRDAADGRRLADRRREVVRHLRRRRRRAHRRGDASTATGATLFLVDRRRRRRRGRRRPAVHAHLSARAPDPPLRRVEVGDGRRARRRWAAATTCSARGSPRSGSGSPRAASARCGGCSRRRSPGRPAREQGGAPALDHQGVVVPARRLGRRRRRRAAAGARGRAAGRRRRRPEDRAREGVDGEAVRQRGGLPLRRPRRAGVRRPRLLRDNVAERFLRELRVDRIWEGTSEIQRLIVARVAGAPRRRAGAALSALPARISRACSRPRSSRSSAPPTGPAPTATQRCATSRALGFAGPRLGRPPDARRGARAAVRSRRSTTCPRRSTRSSSRSRPRACRT